MPIIVPNGTSTPAPTHIPPGTISMTGGGTLMVFTGALWIPIAVVTPEEDEMIEFNVSYKTRNVNSKPLLKQFTDLVQDISRDFVLKLHGTYASTYDYSQLVEFLEAYMEDLVDTHKITTYDVVGDHRNNLPHEMSMGNYNLVLKYQQFNCLNVTLIEFTLTKK